MNFASLLPGFLNSNPMIDAATTDDATPTPFHLYMEIAKLTYQGGNVSERLVGHLMSKLNQPSPAVKIKVLLVMHHVLEKGHQQFQRELQKEAEKIRPCLEFRGPPDPIHGEAPYRIVRERAQAVVNALYDTTPRSVTIESFPGQGGGNNTPPQVRLGLGTGKVMEGFGSNGQQFVPSRGEKTWDKQASAVLKGSVESVSELIVTSSKAVVERLGLSTDDPLAYRNEVEDKGRYVSPGQPSMGPPGRIPQPQKKSNSTGVLDPVEYVDHSSGKPGGGWGNDAGDLNAVQSGAAPESLLVDGICTPAGVTLQPSRVQLSQFTAKVKESQNGEYFCFLLAEQLADQDWKRRLRALYAIYELVVNKVSPAPEFFASNGLPSLHSLVASTQKTIRDQAFKILAIVQPEFIQQYQQQPHEEAESPTGFAQQTGSVGPTSSLFVGLDGGSSGTPTGGSLFGALQVSSSSPQTKQPKQQPTLQQQYQPQAQVPTQVQAPVQAPVHVPVHVQEPQPVQQQQESFPAIEALSLIGLPVDSGRPRQSSKSQMESVFNPTQQIASIQSDLEKMQWTIPSSPLPNNAPVPFASAFTTPGYTSAYPGGYIPPATYAPQQFNPSMFSASPAPQQFGATNTQPTGNLGGAFDFVAAKKDPFDFGDIRKLDATI